MGSIYMPPTWLVTDDGKLEHRDGVMFARVFLWQLTFFHPFLTLSFGSKTKLWPAFNEWAAELHYLEGRSFSIIYLEFFYMGYFYLLLQLFIQSLACLLSCSVVSDSLWPYELQPARLLSPWDFSGRNTGVGCHALLQGIFPTQGSNSWFQFHLDCR